MDGYDVEFWTLVYILTFWKKSHRGCEKESPIIGISVYLALLSLILPYFAFDD